jgi:hypothetical protein
MGERAMDTAMPSVADQLAAVLKAPVLFAITSSVFWVVIWRLMEWRYRAGFSKTRELFDLSRAEIEYWKDAAARSAGQAAERVEVLKKKDLPAEAIKVLNQLKDATSRVSFELKELGKANSTVFVPGTSIRAFIEPLPNIHVTDFAGSPRQPPPQATQQTEGH